MRSYTSNSKWKSVMWYVIIVLLIATVYMLGVMLLPEITTVGKGANQRQENIIKAQKYFFDKKDYSTVLVGSSEARWLPVEALSGEYYNLAFSGGSCLTGLAIIEASEKKPKQVLIELDDTVMRGIDGDIMTQISPWHRLTINQERYRIDYNIYSLYRPIYENLMDKYFNTQDSNPDFKLVEMARKTQQELVDEDLLKIQIGRTKEYIESLSDRGINVILLELPNDSELYNTPRNVQVRDILTEYFPDDKYTWFRVDWDDYNTTDGIHLNKASAAKYVDEMAKSVL